MGLSYISCRMKFKYSSIFSHPVRALVNITTTCVIAVFITILITVLVAIPITILFTKTIVFGGDILPFILGVPAFNLIFAATIRDWSVSGRSHGFGNIIGRGCPCTVACILRGLRGLRRTLQTALFTSHVFEPILNFSHVRVTNSTSTVTHEHVPVNNAGNRHMSD